LAGGQTPLARRQALSGPHPGISDCEKVETFGSDVPLGRAGQPNEVAPCYVFLASDDSSYMTGQVLHPNGGEIINV
jgi:NAD(P)-dependent dehydrogenase (short-subunit alcohol dehydrogenase family)